MMQSSSDTVQYQTDTISDTQASLFLETELILGPTENSLFWEAPQSLSVFEAQTHPEVTFATERAGTFCSVPALLPDHLAEMTRKHCKVRCGIPVALGTIYFQTSQPVRQACY